MAEDINIKLNVDASGAVKSTKSISQQIEELRNEMASLEVATNGLSDATEEQRRHYLELQKQAGSLTDTMGDVQRRITQTADDYAGFSAALEATGALVAATQGFTGLAEQLGLTNIGSEQLTKSFLQLQSQLNAINTVQQVFNKDSKLMTFLQTNLNTAMLQGGTAAKKAELAQRGLNLAMEAAPYIAIATALISVVAEIYNFVSANKEATESQNNLNDALNNNRLTRENLLQKVQAYNVEIDKTVVGSKEEKKILDNVNGILGTNIQTREQLTAVAQNEAKALLENQKLQSDLNAKIQDYNDKGLNATEFTRQLVEAESEEQKILSKLALKYPEITKEIKNNSDKLKDNTKDVDKNKDSWSDWVKEQKAVAKALKETEESGRSAGEVLMDLNIVEADTAVKTAQTAQEKLKASIELLQAKEAQEIANIESSVENEELKQAKILNIQADYEQQRKDLYDEYREKEEEAQNKANEKRIAAAQATADAEIEARQRVFDTITNATGLLQKGLADAQAAELAGVEQGSQREVDIKKRYAISNLVLNSIEGMANLALAIPKTLAAYAEIPFVGPALAAVQIAAYTASIVAQVASINNMKAQVSKAAKGAFVVGPSHSQGGVPYELEGGEAVLNKKAMAIPQFRNLASAMNEATGGISFGTNSSAAISARIDDAVLDRIVSKITSIPVIVSEKDITRSQRKVNVSTRYSQF